ncbi:cupin domain-containing protein [Asticcacaulis sp. 201]|uniref:cupin domain-containing protein n=1 Tax=Asticcacaulis sp. 201 TaxID=3028787 RepID=UPI002916A55F|nr:cupin domain-containing protein [Asticcacaulis sp. 201]MDV6330786.1 cupin domain-containing protein [Asticcacaulis sp. 201]
MSKSPHIISLAKRPPAFEGPAGTMAEVNASVFPILNRLSMSRLILAPLGVREPHWYANAHTLGYCLRGEALMTIAGNHSARDSFTLKAGEMFFVPSGAMQHIENTGDTEAEFIMAHTHQTPEQFGISGAFLAMTDAVLANTFDLKADAFSHLKRTAGEAHIGFRADKAVIEAAERHINPYKYKVEATPPQIDTPSGVARLSKSDIWPALKDVSMFSINIRDEGMREPHWHPGTAEMGYVTRGTGRMTILNPDGQADTYVMTPGDVYFIPRAYPHHIEDIGNGDLHVLVFFDQALPGDIGFKSLASCYSRQILASAFDVVEADLPNFPFTDVDPLIVPRGNPIDAVGVQ